MQKNCSEIKSEWTCIFKEHTIGIQFNFRNERYKNQNLKKTWKMDGFDKRMKETEEESVNWKNNRNYSIWIAEIKDI